MSQENPSFAEPIQAIPPTEAEVLAKAKEEAKITERNLVIGRLHPAYLVYADWRQDKREPTLYSYQPAEFLGEDYKNKADEEKAILYKAAQEQADQAEKDFLDFLIALNPNYFDNYYFQNDNNRHGLQGGNSATGGASAVGLAWRGEANISLAIRLVLTRKNFNFKA